MSRYVINRDKINAICDAIGLDKDALPDDLYGNILKAIALKCGASSFPDNLYTTFVRAALTALSVDPDALEHPYLLGELIDTLVEATESGEKYTLINPIDADAFPTLYNFKLLVLDGTENWRSVSTGYYTSDFSTYFSGVSRSGLKAFSEHWEFDADVLGGGDLAVEKFMFNGTSANPVNGNLTFKNSITVQGLTAWKEYLAENNESVLVPLKTADGSEWKPAKRNVDGATGYWNGSNGFIAIFGGIPYYGENLVTDAVIGAAYNNAWISSAYLWTTANNSTSFVFHVTDGAYYKVEWDSDDSSIVGAIFRYGFTNNNLPSNSNVLNEPRERTTPQDVQSIEMIASGDYMVVQVASGTFPENAHHLSVRKMVGYEPPMLMGFMNPAPEPEPNPESDPDTLVCPYCGKTYVMEYYYNQHLLTHETEGGEE